MIQSGTCINTFAVTAAEILTEGKSVEEMRKTLYFLDVLRVSVSNILNVKLAESVANNPKK